LQEAQTKPELHDVFKMFNKYCKQVYPSTTTAAYSIFHEGLNSQDTVKFPENIYGQANQSNQARYTAICNAYSARGAQMDHVFAATKGQVWQRDQQTGYNDAGWNIEEGNYERWISQINPDATSIGLFRVRGVINTNSSKYDRFARSFENSSGKNTMYFNFHSDVFTLSGPDSLTFKITWLDKNVNSTWALIYYNSSGLQTAINITGIGDNQWKTTNVKVHNPIITQDGVLGSDFMLVNTDNIDDIFHGIEVDITRTGTMSSFDYNSRNSETLIFPNPTSSIICWNKNIVSDEIIIYNSKGQVVSNVSKPENNSFSLINFEKGIYFIVFLKEGKRVLIYKLIKV
jgi:hypothetical protein